MCPNPWDGRGDATVVFCLGREAAEVRIDVFTTAYRRIAGKTLQSVPQGTRQEPLPLTDLKGRRLANGLYYVVVRTPYGSSVAKWMVLR